MPFDEVKFGARALGASVVAVALWATLAYGVDRIGRARQTEVVPLQDPPVLDHRPDRLLQIPENSPVRFFQDTGLVRPTAQFYVKLDGKAQYATLQEIEDYMRERVRSSVDREVGLMLSRYRAAEQRAIAGR